MHCLNLVKVYILGAYLNDIRFCNAVMDTLELTEGCVPGVDAIDWVWSKIMQDNPLRDLLLDHWAGALELDLQDTIRRLKCNSFKTPDQFLLESLAQKGTQLCAATARLAEVKKPLAKNLQKCKFHKHVDDSDEYYRIMDITNHE